MDSLIAFVVTIGPQHWAALGLVLLIAEMATGTTYLLWPAVAAFATALMALFGLSDFITQVAVFAILVIALTLAGRPLAQRLRGGKGASGLNERAQALVGVRGQLVSFADGVGSVKVNDTVWRAVSDEALEAGQHVEVTSADGAILKVRRLAA